MKKVMISQPMRGFTDEEILKIRNEIQDHLENMGYEVVDTFFYNFEDSMIENTFPHPGVYFLGRSLEKMSECAAVFFCKGWEQARGCAIEHAVATSYGLDVMYEA